MKAVHRELVPTLHLIFGRKVGKGLSDSRFIAREPFMRTVINFENSSFQKPSEIIFFHHILQENECIKSSYVGFHIGF